jgi:hypothetical protein
MATTSPLSEEIRRITGGSYLGTDAQIKSVIGEINSYNAEIETLKNKKASSGLDTEYYLKKYTDVARAGANPSQHYTRHGKSEGRFANLDQELASKGLIPESRLVQISEIQKKIQEKESELKQLQAPAVKLSRLPAELTFSADRNYATSDLASKLNFQISDNQIIDDYNNSKLSRLNSVIDRGNAQIAGINERLNSANKLLADLPANSAQRASSKVFIKQLNDDLNSVTSAVTEAQDMQKNFKPITADSTEGAKEITGFRSFLQLPEERASQQLRQIDPESYQTSVTLGQKYRQMAETPIGATTTPETEALRQRIEGEAMAQLSLGAQLGAEEQRAYQQAARGAQTARGNIFGVAPAVEEAVTTGAAGEQRKLARYGAAAQFLGSGQTTGDALKADLAFRDALQQNRLGAASDFIAGGPSIYNLSQARTGQQQNAFQNYIQANQALPGGFNQQPSTAAPFYSAVDQSIPVALTNAFANLYGSQANYLSSTYGAQVGALSRQPSGFQNFATAAGGAFDLARGFGALGSAGILCWVAREVYGEDNPKWLQFREWMLTKASDNLRNYYIEYGERIAESIRNRPRVKDIIRRWMDKKVKEMYGS